jgi:hypothetical protein
MKRGRQSGEIDKTVVVLYPYGKDNALAGNIIQETWAQRGTHTRAIQYCV